ncbi:GSU2403 family nucleotidyltransferase fold protein [Salinarimonas sp.]|uniref:GSU2403 family nucleotidyltransferase fold protein n=1 Tax=Salinarimonas sp. TaxID=2766526 RepID=UPI0032D8C951
MFYLNSLSNEQRRQLIDARQVFEAWDAARGRLAAHYAGSMRWAARSGKDYLLHKRRSVERSIGPRSAGTEAILARFETGRAEVQDEIARLEERLARMAPVNVALGLARVPRVTARILRRLRDKGLSGSHLRVVGTNALFAYEARAGVLVGAELLATGDADLLLDARRSLRLLSDDTRREGVLGVLRQVDRSFAPRSAGDFRAVNRDGFFVDMVRPQAKDEVRSRKRDRIGEAPADLRAAPIAGLDWLVSAPSFSETCFDDAGYPVVVDTIDPRAFALHKAWLADQPARDPVKRGRDAAQARAAATIAQRHLGLDMDDPALSALPAVLRERAAALPSPHGPEASSGGDEPPPWW